MKKTLKVNEAKVRMKNSCGEFDEGVQEREGGSRMELWCAKRRTGTTRVVNTSETKRDEGNARRWRANGDRSRRKAFGGNSGW